MDKYEFRTKISVNGTTVVATLHGSAESDNFEQVAAFVRDLEAQVTLASANRVVADLRDLEFATSSCLKVLAGWLIDLEDRSAPYDVEFVTSTQHGWQRRSLHALATCAPSVVQVTTS
jgi:hypothetical protein